MAARQHELTMIAPIVNDGRDALDALLIAKMGYQNPDAPYNKLLRAMPELHFASFFTFETPDYDRYLVLEANFDGSVADFVKNLILNFRAPLEEVFAYCGLSDGDDLGKFIKRHRGYPDCFYVSCPGLDCEQIKHDRCLQAFLREERDNLVRAGGANHADFRQVVTHLHDAATSEGLMKPLAPPPATRVRAGPPAVLVLGVLIPLAVMALFVLAIGKWSVVGTVPLQTMLIAGAVAALLLAYRLVSAGVGIFSSALLIIAMAASAAGVIAITQILSDEVFMASRIGIGGLLAIAVLLCLRIRGLEKLEDKESKHIDSGWIDDRRMRDICVDENTPGCMQNHFVNMSVVKPGLARLVTLRLVLWVIHLAGVIFFNRGMLGGIPSIHFARWIVVPGKKSKKSLLLFMTNYDSSWDSYLGDFVDGASVGVSGIWSNTGGFPRTWYLIYAGGSRFEKHFKAYARRGQQRSRAWYSAYPNVSVQQKLSNIQLRRLLEDADAQRGTKFGYQDDILRRL